MRVLDIKEVPAYDSAYVTVKMSLPELYSFHKLGGVSAALEKALPKVQGTAESPFEEWENPYVVLGED